MMTPLMGNGFHRCGVSDCPRTWTDRMWTVLLMMLFTTRLGSAQQCSGNPNVGCTHPGATCRPVATGTGSQGLCTTPKGLPKGELTCECAGTPVPPPPLFDVITYPAPPAGTDAVIRIDRPNPKQPSTEYPQIIFQPGDTVTIHAGGCVQGGGGGRTWRRYVTPTQSDPRYYFGLITIPFATEPLAKIEKYWNQPVHIADNAPAARLHLQLGYEDEQGKYDDNGYYSHDDGPGNQCAGDEGGPAWVQLDVQHKGPTTAATPASWDLVLADFDDNGIPLNPNWGSNVFTGHFPDPSTCRWPWQGGSAKNCASTGQITNTDFDSAAGYSFWNPIKKLECASCSLCQTFSSNYGYGGHANWMAATQTGTVYWEEKSGSILGDDYLLDDEYSVNIDTPNAAGATAGRPDGVHIEFDASETIDILTNDMKIPWWQQFRSAVDGSDDQAHSVLDGKDMIVTGLMAVDFAHASTGPESHPAWAIAVHSNTDFSDDTWAFFVRTSGDEGYCSEQQHYISYLDDEYTFRFPWPKGASSPTLKTALVLSNGPTASQAEVSVLPGEAVLLTISNVPDQNVDHGLVGGELHLAWAGSPTASARMSARRVPVATPPELGETIVSSAIEKMTATQRSVYKANTPQWTRTSHPILRSDGRLVPPTQLKRVQGRRPTISAVRNQALVAHRNAAIDALTKAYGGTLPTK
jgi:hypothetical protein